MDSFERSAIYISVTICIIFSIFAFALAADSQNKVNEIEKRVLVLETKINMMTGVCNG